MTITQEEADERLHVRLVRSIRVQGTGCWMWTGTLRPDGYGVISRMVDGKWTMRRAHRVSYELHVGPIPDGLQLDHLCRKRACVNPAHLEPVTNRINGLRGISFCAQNAVKTHCPLGHEYTPENTYTKASRCGTPARECKTCQRDNQRLRYARRRES